MASEHHDVLIVGAGLSGIGAAVHIHRSCPGKRYVILEGRPAMGGTWDLFRYPGIRSDSDMHTLGYSFKPWREAKAIADGPAILNYVREAAAEYGVDDHIRFGHRATRASWSSEDAAWTVEAARADTGETVRFTCNFLLMCAGYYSYQQGYTPEFEGRERFRGTRHPPPAVARGPGLPGQAGRGDRLRRHRDDARAGDGEGRRPRRHAAAIADVRRLATRPRRDRERPARRAARALGVRHHALEERRAPAVPLSPDAHASRAGQAEAPRPGAQGARARLRRRDPLHPTLQSVGSATLPGAEQRSVRSDPVREGRDRHRSDRALHGDRHRARLRHGAGGGHHRDRDGLEPRRAGRDAIQRRRRRRRFRADVDLQGDDVLRRAEPRLHLRIHQRLVDAARGPHGGVRLPAAQPHGRDAARAR